MKSKEEGAEKRPPSSLIGMRNAHFLFLKVYPNISIVFLRFLYKCSGIEGQGSGGFI